MRLPASVVTGLVLSALLAGCASGDGNPDAAPGDAGPSPAPFAACPEQPDEEATGGAALPPLAFDCLGGGSLDLGRAPGVPTVINLWGSWCGPCREELPLLQEFADAAGDRVRVLGVISKDGAPQAGSFAFDAGVRFPNAFDADGQLMAQLGLNGLPYTAFVAADGSLVHSELGPVASVQELEVLVAEHLGVQL
jgi:cytochrome c biogenesis protein CcmG/thiol:disulfide interchange protein DsbE